jgi:hypothetical protein
MVSSIYSSSSPSPHTYSLPLSSVLLFPRTREIPIHHSLIPRKDDLSSFCRFDNHTPPRTHFNSNLHLNPSLPSFFPSFSSLFHQKGIPTWIRSFKFPFSSRFRDRAAMFFVWGKVWSSDLRNKGIFALRFARKGVCRRSGDAGVCSF